MTAGKPLSSRLQWNQSIEATLDVKIKRKKQVRYHPTMIRYAVMTHSKLNNTHNFVNHAGKNHF